MKHTYVPTEPTPPLFGGGPDDHRDSALGLARRTDPKTSHAAARRVVGTGTRKHQQGEVLRLVLNHPGMNAAELARFADGMDKHQVNRRTGELIGLGLIRAEGERNRMRLLWPASGKVTYTGGGE